MIKRLVVIVGEGPCPTASDMANKLNEVIGAINQNTGEIHGLSITTGRILSNMSRERVDVLKSDQQVMANSARINRLFERMKSPDTSVSGINSGYGAIDTEVESTEKSLMDLTKRVKFLECSIKPGWTVPHKDNPLSHESFDLDEFLDMCYARWCSEVPLTTIYEKRRTEHFIQRVKSYIDDNGLRGELFREKKNAVPTPFKMAGRKNG